MVKEDNGVTRCGFCGVYMIDGVEVNHQLLTAEQLEDYISGYCPNAQQEYFEQNPQEAN